MSTFLVAWIGTSNLARLSVREYAVGLLLAVAAFVILGTTTALWPNPLFTRMTPTSGFETTILTVQSALLGLYMGMRRTACATASATTGGVLGFLGIACPVCNKILLFLFGSDLLLTYFEPIRLYVGLTGVAVTIVALLRKSATLGSR